MSGCSRYVIGFFVVLAALTFTLTAKHGEGSEAGVSGRYAFATILWLIGIAMLVPWGRSVTGRLAAGGVGLLLVGLNVWQISDGEFRPMAVLWGAGGICAIIFALTGSVPEMARGFLGIEDSRPNPTRKKRRRPPDSESSPRKKRSPRTSDPTHRPRRPHGG
jgi:hypothetical protein